MDSFNNGSKLLYMPLNSYVSEFFHFILAWIYPGYLLVQKQQMLSVRPALGKEFRLSFDIRMEPIKRKSHILSINSNDNLNRLRVVIGNNKKYCEIKFLKYKYDCRKDFIKFYKDNGHVEISQKLLPKLQGRKPFKAAGQY